ncbi:MAG: hypothetical protein R3F62_01930 [Planctomycetota bacterium]
MKPSLAAVALVAFAASAWAKITATAHDAIAPARAVRRAAGEVRCASWLRLT